MNSDCNGYSDDSDYEYEWDGVFKGYAVSPHIWSAGVVGASLMDSRTIATKLGEIAYIPELLDRIERYAKEMNIDEEQFLKSMGFLFISKYMESRNDLSATYTDETAGEFLIETQKFMERHASSLLDKDPDVLN